MHTLQQCDTLIAVLSAKPLQDVPPGAAALWGERLESGRIEIVDDRSIDRSGHGAFGTDFGARLLARECGTVGLHELIGSWRAQQRHLLATGKADIAPNPAVSIPEFVNV